MTPHFGSVVIEEETSVRIYFVSVRREALVSLTHAYLGSVFLDAEDFMNLIWGPSGTLVKERGSSISVSNCRGYRA